MGTGWGSVGEVTDSCMVGSGSLMVDSVAEGSMSVDSVVVPVLSFCAVSDICATVCRVVSFAVVSVILSEVAQALRPSRTSSSATGRKLCGYLGVEWYWRIGNLTYGCKTV